MSLLQTVARTGNSVADVQYRTVRCRHCHGTGRVHISRAELVDRIMATAFGKSWQKLLAIYRDWKKNGETVICDECNGEGSWEEWR